MLEPTLDGLPDPVIAIDNAGTLHYANQVASDVLGWPRDEIVGRSVLDLLHPDDLNLAMSSMETVGTKKVGELIRVRALTADGSWMGLEVDQWPRDQRRRSHSFCIRPSPRRARVRAGKRQQRADADQAER